MIDESFKQIIENSWPDVKQHKKLFDCVAVSSKCAATMLKLSALKLMADKNTPKLQAALKDFPSAFKFARHLVSDAAAFEDKLLHMDIENQATLTSLTKSLLMTAQMIAGNDYYDGTEKQDERILHTINKQILSQMEKYAQESSENENDALRLAIQKMKERQN